MPFRSHSNPLLPRSFLNQDLLNCEYGGPRFLKAGNVQYLVDDRTVKVEKLINDVMLQFADVVFVG